MQKRISFLLPRSCVNILFACKQMKNDIIEVEYTHFMKGQNPVDDCAG
jgi:hypothetical protein